MATGRWRATGELCATIVNANPYRPEGVAAEPRHFDPYGLLASRRPHRESPGLKVRVSEIKRLFTGEA